MLISKYITQDVDIIFTFFLKKKKIIFLLSDETTFCTSKRPDFPLDVCVCVGGICSL